MYSAIGEFCCFCNVIRIKPLLFTLFCNTQALNHQISKIYLTLSVWSLLQNHLGPEPPRKKRQTNDHSQVDDFRLQSRHFLGLFSGFWPVAQSGFRFLIVLDHFCELCCFYNVILINRYCLLLLYQNDHLTANFQKSIWHWARGNPTAKPTWIRTPGKKSSSAVWGHRIISSNNV